VPEHDYQVQPVLFLFVWLLLIINSKSEKSGSGQEAILHLSHPHYKDFLFLFNYQLLIIPRQPDLGAPKAHLATFSAPLQKFFVFV